MDAMIVNVTTEASWFGGRAVARHDLISVTGYEGTVAGVHLRYTTLQRDDGKVLIPNSILFTNPIQLRSRTP